MKFNYCSRIFNIKKGLLQISSTYNSCLLQLQHAWIGVLAYSGMQAWNVRIVQLKLPRKSSKAYACNLWQPVEVSHLVAPGNLDHQSYQIQSQKLGLFESNNLRKRGYPGLFHHYF